MNIDLSAVKNAVERKIAKFTPSPATMARREAVAGEGTARFLALAREGMRAGRKAATGEASAFGLLAKLAILGDKLMDLDAPARAGCLALLAALADPDARDAALARMDSATGGDES